MKKIWLITIITLIISTTSVIGIDVTGSDTFVFDVEITNDNNYRAIYEFTIMVLPDSIGFNVTIIPTTYEFDKGETKNVTVFVNSSIAIAPDAYEFVIKYTITQLGDGKKTNGGGGGGKTYWYPTSPPIPPDPIPPAGDDDDDDDDDDDFVPLTYTLTKNPTWPYIAIVGALMLILMFIILMYYKTRGKKNENT